MVVEKVIFKLKKQPLSSEIKERQEKNRRLIIMAILCLCFLVLGLLVGIAIRNSQGVEESVDVDYAKWKSIRNLMDNYWLYGNEYEDLDGELSDRAYYGMTTFLEDPYTSYMSEEDYMAFADDINMSFVGLGINYEQHDGVSTVVRVFKDSPAELAGMLPGDIIRKIDGVDIYGFTTDEVEDLALGEEGSMVDVEVERNGELINLRVIRSSIDNTVYAYAENDYVVLEINSFGDNTYNECIHYLDEYQDYSSLIIDLRSNGGGYQNAVQDVATLFLGWDVLVMLQEFKDGHQEEYYTTGSVYYDNFEEIVILVDGNTASAAEVLTIALKEQHPNTTIIGTPTYGKGVVQSTYFLADMSALKITSSKWLSPSGQWIDGEGIVPDIEVYLDDVLYDSYGMMEEDEVYAYDSVSAYTKFAQDALRFLDYDVKRNDGYFDSTMQEELTLYQSAKGLEVSGELDYHTYNSLVSSVIYEWANNPEKDVQMLAAIAHIEDENV